MTRRLHIAAFLAGYLMLSVASSAADDAPALTHNPFARPSSEVTAIDPRSSALRKGPATTITLMATLVGSEDKLANVNGRVIRQGEEIDGFLLIEVHEDHAVFLRAGNRMTVYVKPDLVESDE